MLLESSEDCGDNPSGAFSTFAATVVGDVSIIAATIEAIAMGRNELDSALLSSASLSMRAKVLTVAAHALLEFGAFKVRELGATLVCDFSGAGACSAGTKTGLIPATFSWLAPLETLVLCRIYLAPLSNILPVVLSSTCTGTCLQIYPSPIESKKTLAPQLRTFQAFFLNFLFASSPFSRHW